MFMPDQGAFFLHPGTLLLRQVRLIKNCVDSERSKLERVGTTIFPGLVKVTHGATPTAGGSAQPVGSRL